MISASSSSVNWRRRSFHSAILSTGSAGDSTPQRIALGSAGPAAAAGRRAAGPGPRHLCADLDPELHGLPIGVPSGVPGEGEETWGSARALTSLGMFSKRSRRELQRARRPMAWDRAPAALCSPMCGRARLSSDVSEIKLVFSIRRTGPPRTSRPVGSGANRPSANGLCGPNKPDERGTTIGRRGGD
jgi:hypothetical protein